MRFWQSRFFHPCSIIPYSRRQGKAGHYKELFEQIRKKGYLNVRVDGELKEIFHGMKLDRYKMHSIEVVIDKMIVSDMLVSTLFTESLELL